MRFLTSVRSTITAGRPSSGSRTGDDAGAVATLVVVLLGGAVLLGSGALVVDVGQLYVERQELQSGADAAAMAVAKKCSTNPACVPDAIADSYADRNAKDKRTRITLVCGRGWNLARECPDPNTALTACIGPTPTGTTRYVEVHTATELTDGSTLLPPTFARGFVGKENFQGTSVTACARATLVPGQVPTEMVAPAVTVEKCFWSTYTDEGRNYAATEGALFLKEDHAESGCSVDPGNGMNGPGNFGWLEHLDGLCRATFSLATGWYDGETGNDADPECVSLFDSYVNRGVPMPLPLFDRTDGTGAGFEYHLHGFAAFMVTGYKFSGSSRASVITGEHLCSGNERCLYGYFTNATFDIIRGGGGTDYGARGGLAKIIG